MMSATCWCGTVGTSSSVISQQCQCIWAGASDMKEHYWTIIDFELIVEMKNVVPAGEAGVDTWFRKSSEEFGLVSLARSLHHTAGKPWCPAIVRPKSHFASFFSRTDDCDSKLAQPWTIMMSS